MDRLLPVEWRKTIAFVTGEKICARDPLATETHPRYPNRLWRRNTGLIRQ
jgi:hypothetical protein